jgi:hypothetical protein
MPGSIWPRPCGRSWTNGSWSGSRSRSAEGE